MTSKRPPVIVFAFVLAALLIGLLLNVSLAHLSLGRFQALTVLAIASVQAWLIVLYFMHLQSVSRLLWLFAAAGFFWLAILTTLALTDYLSRGWEL